MNFFIDNNYLEFTISLFTRCNLRCGFCAQKHDKDLDVHELLSIPDKVFTTFIKERLQRPNIREVGIRLWGGELFSDDIPMKYFEHYTTLVDRIKDKFEGYDVTLQFLFTTNATFNNTARVAGFLEKTKGKLAISYDPTLRYKSEHMDMLVRKNINALHNFTPITVGIVLTKPTLEYYNNNFNEFRAFVMSPAIDSVVFNYYIPNEGWKEHMPSDDLLGAFFIRCLDENIPNIVNLELLKESFKQQQCVGKECECAFLPNIFEGQPTKNCVTCFSNLPQDMFYGQYLDQAVDISSSRVENISELKALIGTEKRGCLMCEHAEICPGMCWTSIIFEGYKATRCPLKMCYNYLESN